jgi:predicted phage tail protein
VDNTIKNNTAYFYRVFAENLIGDTWDYSDPELNEGAGFPTKLITSAYSNVVTLGTVPGGPAGPSNLVATVQAGPQVQLTWKDNANNETGYVVERGTDGISFSVLVTLGANATSYVDTTVVPGGTYFYRVKAVNAGGDSAYSNVVSVTIPGPPAAPSGLAGTTFRQGNNARVTLTWNDNSNNESGFTLQRATNLNFTAGVNNTNIAANATTFTTGNLPRNTTFYFRIRAYNAAGTSAWSNILIITTAP